MSTRAARPVELSICMVSLNCRQVITDCLQSIHETAAGIDHEVLIVDNASTDDTLERATAVWPDARILRNSRNFGFSRATNQAIQASRGRYLLWLNTDTVLHAGALQTLISFLAAHPRAGIVGPKVLNADGTFQPQCRRGMPTPGASLCYMMGLHRVWPRHPLAGQYLLSYLPVDERSRVASVSGCCLLARREVWASIGPIDEAIFGFGEDIDWCVRAEQAGWEVWYEPAAAITHLKGQGGAHVKPYHKIRGIHQAMWVFYRKHLRAAYPAFVTLLVGTGVLASFAASMAGTWLRRRTSALARSVRGLIALAR